MDRVLKKNVMFSAGVVSLHFAQFSMMCICIHREAFEPMMESGELVVRYRARRTYSRRTTEATCEFPSLPLHVTQKDDLQQ